MMNLDINSVKLRKEIADIITYVNDLFFNAVESWASDVHIEPNRDFILIRFREDWDFTIYDKIDVKNTSTLLTRMKVLARVKIDENKKPQDWKIVYNYEPSNWGEREIIDIRFSTLPTAYWEKIVLRILRQDTSLIDITKLWLLPLNLERVRKALKSKYWIILVAWPTGSWKSTTLFWVLKNYNPLEFNISTLEDPIEYDIDYVNQSQVRPDIWYGFADWLKSLMRQDPDIIMVWEIRDKETSNLAVEAALTGHLVVSTIHTNSAAATIQRLTNMGVESFLLVSALKMIISQRLAKRTCKYCKVEDKISEARMETIRKILDNILSKEDLDNIKFYKWAWCEKCNHTGYKWRLWIHEVLIMDDYLEKPILEDASANYLKELAMENGMITIVQDALLKATLWDTTVEEALKLI